MLDCKESTKLFCVEGPNPCLALVQECASGPTSLCLAQCWKAPSREGCGLVTLMLPLPKAALHLSPQGKELLDHAGQFINENILILMRNGQSHSCRRIYWMSSHTIKSIVKNFKFQVSVLSDQTSLNSQTKPLIVATVLCLWLFGFLWNQLPHPLVPPQGGTKPTHSNCWL